MTKKAYKNSDNKPAMVKEPAVAYRRMESTDAVDWNPNTPVHATQEEWWERIHQIEKGSFMSWEEHKKKYEAWKMEFLANRMM